VGCLNAGFKVGKGVAGLRGFALGVEHVEPGFAADLILAKVGRDNLVGGRRDGARRFELQGLGLQIEPGRSNLLGELSFMDDDGLFARLDPRGGRVRR